MSAELVERLLGHWKSWGSPTDRDAEVNEGVMAIDCKEAADALDASKKRVAELEAIAERVYEQLSWVSILEHAKEGMEEWASKPANRKWWRRIDGTPTPNDLMVCVSKAIGEAFRPLHDAAERIVNPKAAAIGACNRRRQEENGRRDAAPTGEGQPC